MSTVLFFAAFDPIALPTFPRAGNRDLSANACGRGVAASEMLGVDAGCPAGLARGLSTVSCPVARPLPTSRLPTALYAPLRLLRAVCGLARVAFASICDQKAGLTVSDRASTPGRSV